MREIYINNTQQNRFTRFAHENASLSSPFGRNDINIGLLRQPFIIVEPLRGLYQKDNTEQPIPKGLNNHKRGCNPRLKFIIMENQYLSQDIF